MLEIVKKKNLMNFRRFQKIQIILHIYALKTLKYTSHVLLE